jgi:ATP-binding protein involved in chromosome partitioning
MSPWPPTGRRPDIQSLLPAAEQALLALPGVVAASVILTAHRPAAPAPARPVAIGR